MGRPKKQPQKHAGGRPTKMTETVLGKLEQGFKIGLTDLEACCYADISPDVLYDYQKRNPKFCELKTKWKQNPIAKAKNTIFENLEDPKTARWYLERKCKQEFSTKQEIEVTGSELVKQGLSKINEYFGNNKE